MSPQRLAVYVAVILVGVFGIVFVADALVESDEERLALLEASIAEARPAARAQLIAGLASQDPVAIVADRRREWLDAADGERALREAIDAAVPELAAGAPIVGSDATLTGQRARITLRLRGQGASAAPVDVLLELAHAGEHFSLLEVRRLR